MTRPMTVLFAALIGVLLLTSLGRGQPDTPNPLKVAPLPQCGPADSAFQDLLGRLRQRLAWRGQPERQRAELKLYIGRNGAWTLFYHAYTDEGERICAVARGTNSVAVFGRPV